jgi:hypothetical protein
MEKTLTFSEKLLEVQKRLKPIVKDSNNPFFKSKYADINAILAEVRPLFIEQDLLLTQAIIVKDGKNVLGTQIADTHGNGLQSEMILPEIADPQKFGACITYFRRFSLMSLLALEAEDDDGNTASGKTEEKGKVQGYVPAAIKKEIKLKQEAEFDEFMQTEIYKK